MELDDCAFPLLKGIVATASLDEGFRGVNWALLVGSVSRKPGMERNDLLSDQRQDFHGPGQSDREKRGERRENSRGGQSLQYELPDRDEQRAGNCRANAGTR